MRLACILAIALMLSGCATYYDCRRNGGLPETCADMPGAPWR